MCKLPSATDWPTTNYRVFAGYINVLLLRHVLPACTKRAQLSKCTLEASLKPVLLRNHPTSGTWCKYPYLAITLHLDYCQAAAAHLYVSFFMIMTWFQAPLTAATTSATARSSSSNPALYDCTIFTPPLGVETKMQLIKWKLAHLLANVLQRATLLMCAVFAFMSCGRRRLWRGAWQL